MTVKILHNQSLFDISTQHTGSAENAFQIAKENGISVTQIVVAGNELIIPSELQKKSEILNYYSAKRIMPATDYITVEQQEDELAGIGIWIIGKNFKVS